MPIAKIFWDLDETLVHSKVYEPEYDGCIKLSHHGRTYWTKIRPSAKELIEFSRSLVGKENVYILTAASADYAHLINTCGGFDFDHANIFSSEDLSDHKVKYGYGGEMTIGHFLMSNPNNVLIDDLHPKYNDSKMGFLGIRRSQYVCHGQPYDGYDCEENEDSFKRIVIDYLEFLKDE